MKTPIISKIYHCKKLKVYKFLFCIYFLFSILSFVTLSPTSVKYCKYFCLFSSALIVPVI